MPRHLLRLALIAALTLLLGAGSLPAQADDPAPVPASPTVVVTGPIAAGSTLTATASGFDSDPSFEWFDDDEDPLFAIGPTYQIKADDVQRAFIVHATGLVGGVPTTVESAQTLHLMGSDVPTITTSSYAVGSVLTARPGPWTDGVDFAYQWYASGEPIAGADEKSFRLTSRQGGKQISVHVVGSRSDYQSVDRGSDRTGKILSPTPKPSITGTTAVGRRVSVRTGRWARGTRFGYQWYAGGKAIRGAHGASYKISSGAAGKRLQVKVRGTKSGFETVARLSGSTSRVQRIGRTTLSGSTVVGKRVSVHSRGWVRGTRLSYAWYLDGKRISGAHGTSVGIRSGWVGKHLSAHVTGRKAEYRTFTSSSKRSRAISKPKPKPVSHGPVAPVSDYDCPASAPVKGNANSGIYHVPGGRYYDVTKPEECFRTAADAERAGYRASKNG